MICKSLRRIIGCLVVVISCLFNYAYSQESYNMLGFELQIEPLMNDVFSSKPDNERFAANEQMLSVMEDALLFDGSFDYDFPKLNKINILKSKDKKFRILTWAIEDNEGFWENYGYIQVRNDRRDRGENESEYDVYRLFDKSRNIVDAELQKLSDSLWFGAVYYDLIMQKSEGRTYYFLLGWSGKDIYSQYKIIEPICFKGSSTRPIFGQNVFYKEKDRMRMVFEYSKDALFTLRYADSYYEISTNEKAKSTLFHKVKPFEKQSPATKRQKMLFFDDLTPQISSMDGLRQYYVPSGEVIGMVFEDGKWKKIKYNVLPRNNASKDDDYVPDNDKHQTLFPDK